MASTSALGAAFAGAAAPRRSYAHADGLFDCLQRFSDGVHGVIIPIDAQLAGASHDQPRVAGFGVVAHLVVSVIRGEQRIDDSLRTTGNLVRTLIHELRIGDRHVVAGHDPCGHAGHPHLQVLTVFRVIVHLPGVSQRPQFDQSGADGHRIAYRGIHRHMGDRRRVKLECHIAPSLSLSANARNLPPCRVPGAGRRHRGPPRNGTAGHSPPAVAVMRRRHK